MSRIAMFLLLLSVGGAAFVQPRLVKDINPTVLALGSNPGILATTGNTSFFFASDPEHGNELWKTDGTPSGTVLVRDIWPGEESGVPNYRFGCATFGNGIFFLASDRQHGQEPWISDGTPEGTKMVAGNTLMTGSLVFGAKLYFSASTPSVGWELGESDGTPEGTRVALDLNPGFRNSGPVLLGVIGSRFLIDAYDGTSETLFTSDGTPAGTRAIAPITRVAVSLGNVVVAFVNVSTTSASLLRTDGTAEGTVVIHTGFQRDPWGFSAAGGLAYFAADDGVSGTELWRTDGTAAGTYIVRDLKPGPALTTFESFVRLEPACCSARTKSSGARMARTPW